MNSITDDEGGVDDECLCYPLCDQTVYTEQVSSTPYPGPEAGVDSIINQVFGAHPTNSHLCYARYEGVGIIDLIQSFHDDR